MFRANGEAALWAAWLAIATGLLAAALTLLNYSHLFAWSVPLSDIPSVPLALGGVFAGLVYVNLAWLIPRSLKSSASSQLGLLALMMAVGLVLRLIMLATTPALEDDFYRYLWDGGVVADGLNPYQFAPQPARDGSAGPAFQRLAMESGAVIDRVNHDQLKTIYPPVAQFWFGVAHSLTPWSLNGLRYLGLGFEFATLSLICLLLMACGRSLLWSALYWWNPIVIKELGNSVHMEFMLLPLVLMALLLTIKGRSLLAVVSLAFAAGTKLWPVVLLPLIARPLAVHPAKLILAACVFLALCIAWAAPVLLGGVDDSSGFVAFAKRWQTNSALFQNLNALAAAAGNLAGLAPETTGLLLRGLLATVVGVTAIQVARHQSSDALGVVQKSAIVVSVLFLVSPAQFPWYAAWVIIFLPFVPLSGLLAMTVTLPIYYVSFHLASVQRYDIFNDWFLWIIWVPVWLLLARDAYRIWRRPLEWSDDAR